MLHNAKTSIFITVGLILSLIRFLLNFKRAKLPTPQTLETLLHVYRELSILLSSLLEISNKIIGNVLGLAYFLIMMGMFCVIFGIKGNDSKMIIVFLFITVVVFCAVLFIFKFGDFLHSCTFFILKRWRNRCSKWKHVKGKILLREVESCRLIMVKAGEISVITVKLQEGFLNSLLQDSMTALILWKSNFKEF